MIFLIILALGFLYEYNEGALEIKIKKEEK
jgi:NADH:ubiquinone oxidoreductase subunit 3 (subunit A)